MKSIDTIPGRGLYEMVGISGDPDVAEVAVLRFRSDDRHCVECVDGLDIRHPRRHKWIINVSTQFGCPVRCDFCDAGGAYHGNLSCEEIADQIRFVADRHPDEVGRCEKLKVHFARMGEPALNDDVLEVIRTLPEILPAPGLWCCVATVAPSRRMAWFDRLIRLKNERYVGRFQLQFSINTTDEALRERLYHVPVMSFDRLAGLGRSFFVNGDRRIVLNFALSQDWSFDTDSVARWFSPEHFAIKVTPLNPTQTGGSNALESAIGGSDECHVRRKLMELERLGYDVILSINDERENRVRSNCGQAVRVVAGS